MTTRTWMIRIAAGLCTWAGLGFGVAQAGIIFPVDPLHCSPGACALLTGLSVPTVSIFQNGVDITNTWLPEPGQTVTIVVNGLASPTITLVPPVANSVFNGTSNPFLSALTTSAYPGVCTNSGSPTDPSYLAPDFTFDPTTNQLTSTDCGGMAVIQVSGGGQMFTFVLPQDSNLNGIPDIWETVFCPSNSCPTGREDNATITGNPQVGDGIAAFDKYRGFIVSGVHVRLDPRQKNLFIHLVNPQCSTSTASSARPTPPSTASLLGGTTQPIFPTDGTSLFANLTNLFGTKIQVLGFTPGATNGITNEWVDQFASYSVSTGFVYAAGTDGATSDRQINRNAVFPILDTATGTTIQKGIRITECLDDTAISPMGFAGRGSANGPDNAVLYTQRIVKYMDALVAQGGTLKYSTFTNGAWATPTLVGDAKFLISKVIEYYLGMEIAHAILLTPTLVSTNKVSYGYHFAPFSGDNLDQAFTNTFSTKGNNFYIPTLYNSTDVSSFKLRD